MGGDSGCGRPALCPSLLWDLSSVLSSLGASFPLSGHRSSTGDTSGLDQQQQGFCEYLLKERIHTPEGQFRSGTPRFSPVPAASPGFVSLLCWASGGRGSVSGHSGPGEAQGCRDALTVTKSSGSGGYLAGF